MLARSIGAAQRLGMSRSTESTPDNERARLIRIVAERSLKVGDEVTLASGRKSTLYFDMKRTLGNPEGITLISHLLFEKIKALPYEAEFVGGLAMGAVPISLAISVESYAQQAPLPSFWIRPEAKKHGTMATVEGVSPSDFQGRHAVVVDDVTTSGRSVLDAVAVVRGNGGIVLHVLTVVDRQEGAIEALAEAGIELQPLFTATEIRNHNRA